MRIWEQKTIYRHGFKFTIKRGSRYARTAGSKGRSVHLPEFVLSMEGKFLCRLNGGQLRRWMNHYALKALNS